MDPKINYSPGSLVISWITSDLICYNMIIKINLFILLALLLSGCKNSSSYETVTTSTGEWQLIWNDEFGYTGLPDSTKWSYDTEGNSWGWGNNEAQYYTAMILPTLM